MPEQYTITGTIIPPESVDRADIKVQVFDRDLPSLERRQGSTPQLLGVATTNAEGRFQITYTLEQFQAGEGIPLFRRIRTKNADLSFRIFDRSGQELSIKSIEAMDLDFVPDQIIFNAPPELKVSIYVESPRQAGDSEYEKLLALIAPVIEGVPLNELTDEDVSFMLNELGVDQHLETQQKIEWLRRSALLAQETNLPTEAFYGWGRVNLVDAFAALAVIAFEKLPSVLEKLTYLSEDELRQGLLKAIGEDIIPAILRERVDEIVRQLKRRGQILRTVKAQLLDEETKIILAGYTVMTFDEDAGDENRGLDITDNRGWFVFDFYIPRSEPERLPKRKFRLEVQTPEGKKLPEDGYISVDLTKPEADIVLAFIKIPKPEIAERQEAFNNVLSDAPPALQRFLTEELKIQTFADIRRKGGLSYLPDLPKDDPAFITKLESLADLDRISPDVQSNMTLIGKGFGSVSAIANSQRFEFIKQTREELGDFKAVKLHTIASVQSNFLNDFIITTWADQANNFPLTDEQKLLTEGHPKNCSCKDCEAAVSPLAYLADLIRYTTQHVKNTNTLIDIDYLVTTFHQPFRDLSLSCEASERKIRQVRICIEVLRSYLKANNPSSAQFPALTEQERFYRIAAYTSLLNKIGASFDEIRRAKNASNDERQGLAERLGIELTPSLALDDELGELLLDLDKNASKKDRALSERKLEELFGLVDTNRDVLSEGAKLGDSGSQIKRWNLDNIFWNKNTDINGSVFLSLTHDAAANVYRIELFKDQTRMELLASAESSQPEDTVSLLPSNNSELFGSIHFSYIVDIADIEIVAVPRLLSWRLRHLRKLWEKEDRPEDPYSTHLLPIIDPDIVGPDDFRPLQPGIPDPIITRWKARRVEVDTLRNSTKVKRETNAAQADKGVNAVLAASIGKTLAELKGIKADYEQTNDAEKQRKAYDTITAALHLTIESFNELVTLLGSAASLEPDQWDDVYAILTQAQKTAEIPTWIAEEKDDGIVLGPNDFWIALNEPDDLPKWLASKAERQVWQESLRQRSQPAIIDPDLVPADYLADPLVGPARTRWKERYERIHQLIKDHTDGLKAVQSAGDDELAYFDSIIKKALGAPSSRFLELEAKRTEGRVIEKDLAQLSLSIGAFNYLLKFRHLLEQANQMLEAEWQNVFSILIQVWKERQYAQWRDEEGQDNITLSQDHFQLPVPTDTAALSSPPPPLPEWRATRIAQQDWKGKLDARINAELSIFAGISDAIDATEDATLTSLRNALIQALGATGVGIEETAQQLMDRLLIDTKMGGCHKTTRVAQAIETLQLLLFRLRSGKIQERKDWVYCERLTSPHRQVVPVMPQSLAPKGSNSSIRLLGQVGSFSRVSFSQEAGSRPLSLAVPSRV